MGLISHDWAELQNTYLRSLGAKISGVIWISALIIKLRDTELEICNFRNHTLHATDGPQKTEILGLINIRVARHFNRGISGLLIRCHFLLKTDIHPLLSRPVCQQLSWLSAVSSSCQCSQRNLNWTTYLLDVDQLLLNRINYSCLIPSLTTFDQSPTLITVAGPEKPTVSLLKKKTNPCFTKTLTTTQT